MFKIPTFQVIFLLILFLLLSILIYINITGVDIFPINKNPENTYSDQDDCIKIKEQAQCRSNSKCLWIEIDGGTSFCYYNKYD